MKIEVFALGCSKCRLIEVAAHAAVEELGLKVDIDKIQDYQVAQSRGVTAQPAIFINGKLKAQGGVPSVDQIKEWILQEQGKIVDYSII